ncbi:hypothetical protein RHOSPDRAFT_35162 [Rhodotorula sp. JG-1b]|nr:hypothetical protein RHOSPDRAFT_35162 [Rhodotorula sp. JG-1b]
MVGSAYAPQLGTRLHLTSTQLNTVGAAGNLGVYLSSPVIGRIVDKRGPKPTLVFAAIALTCGYLIIRAFYTTAQDADNLARRTDPGGWFAIAGVPGLVAAQLLTGMGSTAGLSSVGNSVAKSFRKRRAAALSVVLSGFGLSAFFYSTLSSLFLHPATTTAAHLSGQPRNNNPINLTTLSFIWLTGRSDDEDTTSAFLLSLALGSLFSMLVGLIFVEPVPPLSTATPTLGKEEEESRRPILSSGAAAIDDEEDEEEEGGGGSESGLTVRVVDSRADRRDGAENPRRAMTPGASSGMRPEEEEEEEEATPTSRALSHRRCKDENGPTDRTPLLLGPPAPPAGHTSTDSTTAAGAVPDRNNITDINNLGTIVRSLSYPLQAESTLTPAQIARHQARLVSLLSIFNFLGRLVSGFGSDYLLHRRRKGGSQATKKTDSGTGETRSSSTTATPTPTRGSIPRVVFLPLTSLLFLLSQLSLLSISHDPAYLFLPTALTGLAHGCLFGLSGIIGLERFGIKSFSQTNGVLALAPALFGQTTNLLFGRIYDSHLSSSSLPSPPSFLNLEHFAAPPSICTLGQACYVRATYLTCGMSLAATVVGIGLALGRKEMRISRVP